MKLYLFYLKLSILNAFKKPNQALKMFPGLGFIFLGFVFFIGGLMIQPDLSKVTNDSIRFGLTYAYGTANFILFIYLFQILFDTGLGFRASDANLLMKAPIEPFKAYLFVIFKQLILMIGVALTMLGSQASGIVLSTGNKSLLFVGVMLFILSMFFLSFFGYIIVYFKQKNLLLTRLGLLLFVTIVVGLIVNGFLSGTLPAFTLYHMVPFLGWSLGILYHFQYGNFVYFGIYFALYLVGIFLLFWIAKSLKFEYYEFELSKVAKTEKQYRKMMGEGNNDLKLFRKSNASFKNVGDKVLMDYVNIVAGKYWFVSLKTTMYFIAAAVTPFMAMKMLDNTAFNPLLMMIIIVIFKIYFGSLNITASEIYTNFYVKLFPIPTFKKIFLIQTVKVKILLLELLILMISIQVSSMLLGTIALSLVDTSLLLLVYTIVGMIDIFREDNLLGFLKQKLGQTLTLIISILETIFKLLFVFGVGAILLFNFGKTVATAYVVIVLILYLMGVIFLSIYIYDHYDMTKFKSE